ncbi:hypothetical protein JR316_0012064 [Psilocybe cubensis]|uniref:Uncharacterized protein n=2 Tax=Psilocybe cubensis TaxID=181762 RepID=A0ACB8GIS6_PSICU|nr:hypothetical protein JR316_0012064 [Psilocybe cubensis]KAH9474965.1 hypothetical protein JR316_0012064 [Psilocybe cubensis]
MLFRSVFTFLIGALYAQAAHAALTSKQVVTSIKAVTTASQSTNDALTVITTTSSVTEITFASRKLVSGFKDIVTSITAVVPKITSTETFPDDEGKAIIEALTDFVLVHQLLLSTVIGKHSIFAQFSLTAPIAAVLRLLEAQVDALAFALIHLIPTRSSSIQKSQKTLSISLDSSISTYTEFCIPSIFWPAVKPKCVAA